MSSALAAQQFALKRAIVGAAQVGSAGAGAAQAGAAPVDAASIDAAALGIRGRLGIYQAAYSARLVAALRDNFGVLPQVLGDDAFDALAAAYLAAHPSRRPSIRWFGDRLPEFMAARDDLVPHPAIVDLARMEWALRSAFDAADAVPLGVAALAAVAPAAWPDLVFTALPSVQLLALGWNVEPVWRALQNADDAAAMPEPEPAAHGLIVWRPALETRWRSIEPMPARWLQAALQGQPFAALCTLAAEAVGEAQAAPQVAAALRGWVDDGLFSAASGLS